MKKWSYLVAALLTMSTTVTTTSCIDNDEPDGIQALRGAKAELLKAKAAVELAKAETEKQNAAWLAAQAAIAQAQAKYYEAEAALKAAETEERKAWAEAQKAIYEQEVKKAIAEAEAYIAAQQQLLEQTLREIELAKVTLSAEQQAVLATLQNNLANALWNLQYAQQQLIALQKNLFDAENLEKNAIADCEKAVAQAKATLEAVNTAYAELQKLAENVDITAWETEDKELAEYVGTDSYVVRLFNNKYYRVGNGKAAIEAGEIILAGDKALQAATDKKEQMENDLLDYVHAQQYYNYLADPEEVLRDCFNEGTSYYANMAALGDPTTHKEAEWETKYAAKAYDFEEVKVEVENNKWLRQALNNNGLYPQLDEKDGKYYLTIAEAKAENYTGIKYSVISTAFAEDINDDNFRFSYNLRAWEKKASDYKITSEQLEADICKFDAEKNLEEKQKAYDDAVTLFEAMHKQYSTGEVVDMKVSTDDVMTAIDEYNKAYKLLDDAVKAYNAEWDKVYAEALAEATAASDPNPAYYAYSKALSTRSTSGTDLNTTFAATSNLMNVEVWTAIGAVTETITGSEGYKKEAAKYAQKLIKGCSDKYVFLWNGKLEYADEEETNTQVKKYYRPGDKKDEPSGTSSYISTEVSLDEETGKYKEVTGHQQINITAIDKEKAAEYLKLEVDENEVESAWQNASYAAFGYVRHTTLKEDMLKDVEVVPYYTLSEKDGNNFYINGTDEDGHYIVASSALGQLLIAKEISNLRVQLKESMAAAETLVANIQAAEEAVKKAIEPIAKDVEEAAKAVETAKSAHIKSYDAYYAVAKEYEEQLDVIAAKVESMAQIHSDLSAIISAYYAQISFSYVDENGAKVTLDPKNFKDVESWIENQLKLYNKEYTGKIAVAESKLAEAEEALWKVQNDNDFDAVAMAKKKIEDKKAEIELLQSYYDYALAALKNYLETLAAK